MKLSKSIMEVIYTKVCGSQSAIFLLFITITQKYSRWFWHKSYLPVYLGMQVHDHNCVFIAWQKMHNYVSHWSIWSLCRMLFSNHAQYNAQYNAQYIAQYNAHTKSHFQSVVWEWDHHKPVCWFIVIFIPRKKVQNQETTGCSYLLDWTAGVYYGLIFLPLKIIFIPCN